MSDPNEGGSAAGNPTASTFVRSSFCSGGTCLEVSALDNGWVVIRDSKDLSRPTHTYTSDEWVAFVRGVKAGEFDFGFDPASA